MAVSAGIGLIALSVAPQPAAATDSAPAEDQAGPDEAPVDPNLAKAEALFREGQAKYETADYAGAVDLWTSAYALVDSSTENASIKALLIYNLAQAHLKAFDLNKDKIHLKQALQLLQSFQSNLSLLYDDQALLDAESSKVAGRIDEVEGLLAELEDSEREPAADPDEAPAATVEPAQDQSPADANTRSGTPLIAAGGTVIGLGALFGVAGIVGGLMASNANDISDLEPDDLAGREDRFASGRAGNTMLIVGSVGAGVLVPTGIALIVVGALRNKKNDDRRAAALPRLVPSVGGVWGGGGGVTISGRF
ncbi:hypothetical protein [Enhygromyxa salina]|uniref:hypothetical protein n=1 Tax=Enhygromyxa salina TaxID=215803 RepID=UPI000D047367|nr:hypothetical protein [Enhygromyxa salina]